MAYNLLSVLFFSRNVEISYGGRGHIYFYISTHFFRSSSVLQNLKDSPEGSRLKKSDCNLSFITLIIVS